MQDLILDKLISKQLSSFNCTNPNFCLSLEFTDKTRLICYHDQDCCEDVYFVDSRNNNLGIVESYFLEENSYLDEKDLKRLKKDYKNFDFTPKCNDYYTVTELRLNFEDNSVNSFLFLGQSNGYYSETISFRWE